jgi:hypothetical protein
MTLSLNIDIVYKKQNRYQYGKNKKKDVSHFTIKKICPRQKKSFADYHRNIIDFDKVDGNQYYIISLS